MLHIEIITVSVLHTFCSGVYLCLDYFTFLESGNIVKKDLFYTNIEGLVYTALGAVHSRPFLTNLCVLAGFMGWIIFKIVIFVWLLRWQLTPAFHLVGRKHRLVVSLLSLCVRDIFYKISVVWQYLVDYKRSFVARLQFA